MGIKFVLIYKIELLYSCLVTILALWELSLCWFTK